MPAGANIEPSAGEMTERVRFERRAPSEDGYGNTEGDWETLIASRSARLRPTRGGEQTIAARLQGVAAWDLWVHQDEQTNAVTEDDRVVDARKPTRTYNIRFIGDMTGRGCMLLMQLEQGVGE